MMLNLTRFERQLGQKYGFSCIIRHLDIIMPSYTGNMCVRQLLLLPAMKYNGQN
jgi:hypothetical protein